MSSQSGNTPLHYASSDASTEVVQFLLDHGANLHTTNRVSSMAKRVILLSTDTIIPSTACTITVYRTMQDKATPLHFAASSGSTSVVKLLLDKGAIINAMDMVSNVQGYDT